MISLNQKARCKSKKRYSNDVAAREAIKNQQRHGVKKTLRVYKCPVCRGFHLTSSRRI